MAVIIVVLELSFRQCKDVVCEISKTTTTIAASDLQTFDKQILVHSDLDHERKLYRTTLVR